MFTTIKALAWRVIILVMLLVSGCGIQIEVAPTLVPTPFPHPTQHAGSSPNQVWRNVATPRIVFSEQPKAQVFMAAPALDVYLIRGRQATLSVDYDATWFEGAAGNGHVRLTVYKRAAPAQGWAMYDSAERTLTTTNAPSNVHDALTVVLGSEANGKVEIRAEVVVSANNSSIGETKQAGAAEFKVTILDDPGKINPDFAAMKPAVGEIDASIVLADWRSWVGSPCALASIARDDPGFAEVQAACNAALANNPEQTIKSMGEALTKAKKPDLIARLNDFLGLVHLAQKNFGEAALNFSNAASAWESVGRAWELTMSLHNLACARVMQGDGASAFVLLVQLQELHTQYSDEPGQMLAQANMSLVSGNKETLRQAHAYFEANGLAQAAVTQIWLRQLEDKAEGQN